MEEQELEIFYFGTSLTTAGHYFHTVKDISLHEIYDKSMWEELPFNPEELPKNCKKLGEYEYLQIGEYSIIAFLGSPYDRRGGCKSVFFVKANLTENELYEMVTDRPIVLKIIEKIKNK